MGTLVMLLGYACSLAAFVCAIILLIAAFKDTVWKGILGFFCFPYLIYYAFVEYQGENKMPVALGYLLGGIVGAVLQVLGATMMHH